MQPGRIIAIDERMVQIQFKPYIPGKRHKYEVILIFYLPRQNQEGSVLTSTVINLCQDFFWKKEELL